MAGLKIEAKGVQTAGSKSEFDDVGTMRTSGPGHPSISN